jgi:hypothetical protein
MLDLPKIERECLINGLIEEETNRFAAIVKLADDRTRWENIHAHAQDAETIRILAGEISVIAERRRILEYQHEQAKHS